MDPTTSLYYALLDISTMRSLKEAGRDEPAENYRNSVIGHLENLVDWLEKGGFPPKLYRSKSKTFIIEDEENK